MKTLTLVLDSTQGTGTPSNFVVKLNDSIRGCVFSQLRQVILTGAVPSSDYIYIRSSKLGSNVVSGRGFGAFDVVPFQRKSPFVYERYATNPRLDEFECGRLIDSIDIQLVNADNTPVQFTHPSIVVRNGNLFVVNAFSKYTDGTSQNFRYPCVVETGTYTPEELALAMNESLPPSSSPFTEFRVSARNGKIDLAMNWASPDNSGTLVIPENSPIFQVQFDAVYNVSGASFSALTPPLILPSGKYTKEELAGMVQDKLIDFGTMLGGHFTTSLDDATKKLTLNLNWSGLNQQNGATPSLWVRDEYIFTTNAAVQFSNVGLVASPISPVVMSRTGAFSAADFAAALQTAMEPAAMVISNTFRDTSSFLVSSVPFHAGQQPAETSLRVPIFVRLLLSIKNYLNSVEMLPTWFISASSTQIRLTDGREINFPDVSNGPQYYIPAGTYTKASLCDAITRTFTPLQNVMFAEGFTHADFSTTLINEGNVSVQCNWNSGGYEKGIFMPALSFKMRAMIFNRTIYGGSQAEAGERVVIHAGDGMWEHIVNIPAGYYTIGDLAGLIRAQLESFAPVRMTCDLDLNTSMITIKTTNPYTFAKNTNRPPINTQNAWIYLEKIHAGDDLTILGCPNGAVSPAQDDNRIPPYNISFTPQFSFSFCPTAVAPAIQSFVSRINGVEGTITTFTDSTFQGRIVWNLPLPIPFPILANDWFVEQGDIPDSNQWEVNGGTPIATGVDGQYVVDWRFDVLLPKVESVSAQLIFDPSSRLTGIIGLGSSPFAPTGITDLNGATKFSWLFPKPMAYPALDYVDATLTDGSADLGLDPERALEGTMIEFNGLQRKFVWSLSQASSFSKSCVVVELTTT